MLTTTDRKGIRDSIRQWSQRRNVADEIINDMIELALSKANRALRIPPLERKILVQVDDDGYFPIPSEFLEVKNITVEVNNRTVALERKGTSEVDSQAIGPYPCFYAREGNFIRLMPYQEAGEATMYYYTVLPPMTDDNSVNWFTQLAPEVLLYGGLAELAAYTRDDEGEQRWNNKFNEAVNIIQQVEDKAAWWSGDPLSITIQGSH